jgi:hypothetical protein
VDIRVARAPYKLVWSPSPFALTFAGALRLEKRRATIECKVSIADERQPVFGAIARAILSWESLEHQLFELEV